MPTTPIDKFVKDFKDGLGAIIENPINIRYLTNCDIDVGYLLLTKNLQCLLVDDRFLLYAKKISNIDVLRLVNFKQQIKDLVKREKIKVLSIDTNYINVNRYRVYMDLFRKLEIDTSGAINEKIMKQRSVKTQKEIEKIKMAQKLVDESFSYIIEYIKPGMTEKSIAIELEKKLLSLGCESKAFDFIVVSGENTAMPHGKPTMKQINKGDFVTLDFGVKIHGYCCDMTRTISISPLSEEQKKVYNIVLKAQNKAIASVKAGMRGNEIDQVARLYISRIGYNGCFLHSLGHGVGLDVHESPLLAPNSKDIIDKDAVVTVEPGIYIPNKFGVRIEDMILVDSDGCLNLTQSSKELICI